VATGAAPLWTVDVVVVGSIPQLPLAIFVPGAPPGLKIDVDCLAYVLCSASQTIVVDTGPNEELAGAAGFGVRSRAVPALDEALSARGRTLTDVTAVVHTHLHYDHMQNDDAFAAAEILVGEPELEFALQKGTENFYVGIDAFLDANKGRLRTLRSEASLGPGIQVVPTRGHTPGHQAVVVDTSIGPICLAGDEVPMSINVIVPPSNGHDGRATAAFIALARRQQWLIVPSHDPHLGYLGTLTPDVPGERESSGPGGEVGNA
jgi:N-acyl homoserine lactone hydrolase